MLRIEASLRSLATTARGFGVDVSPIQFVTRNETNHQWCALRTMQA
jgi:hypothetical protein